MRLVVGLGNPGPDYAGTRHNVGFRVVERLARRWAATAGDLRPTYRSFRGEHRGIEVALLEPLTYMNVSGDALKEWRERHGVEPGDLLVIADDVYLPVGSVRLKVRGSSGGRRGLDSIEAAIGTRDYARLRVGVGTVDASELKQHVLAEPAGEERVTLDQAADRAADAVECWVVDGPAAAMNRFNRKVRKEVPES